MKIKVTILVLLLSGMSLYGQYFYEDFTNEQKLDTAQAYLMVSERFENIGDSTQADKYKKMALFIYPEILDRSIEDPEPENSMEENINERKIDETDKSSTIRYYFSKFLRSITTGDFETADTLVAERLYIPEYDGGITKSQLKPMAEEIVNKYNLTAYSPSDLYKLDTISIEKIEEGTYLLTVEGADNEHLYTSNVTFFGKIQTFRFRHFESGWKIDQIRG